MRYQGAGVARPPLEFLTEGAHHAAYGNPDIGGPEPLADTMYSGARQSFPLDFTVATNDLDTLELYAYYRTSTEPVLFALRAS